MKRMKTRRKERKDMSSPCPWSYTRRTEHHQQQLGEYLFSLNFGINAIHKLYRPIDAVVIVIVDNMFTLYTSLCIGS